MDVLFFLKERTRLNRQYYVCASLQRRWGAAFFQRVDCEWLEEKMLDAKYAARTRRD
jgi:hypothetical protein